MSRTSILLVCLLCFVTSSLGQNGTESFVQYLNQREALVNSSKQLNFASEMHLSETEKTVNNILKVIQAKELQRTVHFYPFAYNFYQTKQIIDEGEMINILKQMPKGSALHEHCNSAVSWDWFISNATYRSDSYIYFSSNTSSSTINGTFGFFKSPPSNEWYNVNDLRDQSKNVTSFDNYLRSFLEMKYDDYGDYFTIWDKFQAVFARVGNALNFLPVFQGYFNNMFYEYVKDNILHLEIRSSGANWVVYDENGNLYDGYNEIMQVVNNFNSNQNTNFSLRVICAISRSVPYSVCEQELQTCIQKKNQYPDLVIGFDLQGPEDEGHSLLYFAPILLKYQNEISYFFHAGESLEPNNTNLYDAVLLQTKRIGHAYALRRFPDLIELVKQESIGIELCPISNQLLKLVKDMRDHTGYQLIEYGCPVTINSDDPGIYGYSGTTYDYYEAFMAWRLNLQELKQLANNSITHSVWNSYEEYQSAYSSWTDSWNNWIQWVLDNYS